MAEAPHYEIYAIKYGRHERRARENFIGGDPHDGPMPLDYFVWLVRNAERTVVVDTGFSAATAEVRSIAFPGSVAIGTCSTPSKMMRS